MFIDASVTDASLLFADVPDQIKPLMLSSNALGLNTITHQLKAHVQETEQPIESIHLVCHGAPGSLRLGQTLIDQDTLPQQAMRLAQWRSYLSHDAEILLYSCQTAATAAGQMLLKRLSALTGAKVAASSTLVGNAALGGNWELDVRTAPMSGVVAFSATVQAQYAGVFNIVRIEALENASEGGVLGAYRLERDNAQGELVVDFQVSPESTASLEDYTLSGSELTTLSGGFYYVRFAEGQTSTEISVTAVDDDLAEGTENLTLTLRDNDIYTFEEGDRTATVVIFDNETVVTNTNAVGPGSLYQAIENANNNPGLDTITFNIPEEELRFSPGIEIDDGLKITDPVVIDGYSQPGTSPNTLDVGNDAEILIRLQGNGNPAGLKIGAGADGTIIQGLSIDDTQIGIAIGDRDGTQSAPNNVTLRGNYIGLDPLILNDGNGTALYSIVARGEGHIIGGETPAERNIIAANPSKYSILFEDVNNAKIIGNYIGTNSSGTALIDNDYSSLGGISLRDSINNTISHNLISGSGNGITLGGANNVVIGNLIGTDATGTQALGNLTGVLTVDDGNTIEDNVIAFNKRAGVIVALEERSTNSGTTISQNSIFKNGIGIDLFPPVSDQQFTDGYLDEGRTDNDLGDLDEGANGLLNYPVLTTVTQDGSELTIIGELNSKPDETYVLEFFANPESSPNGGQTLIGATFVTTDSRGNGDFNKTFEFATPLNNAFITATTTDAQGSTSEFSVAQAIGISLPTVSLTTTDDPTIREGDTVTYRIERDRANGDMLVRLMIDDAAFGNVTQPEDYTLTAPGLTPAGEREYEITLAEGQISTEITFTAAEDTRIEGKERLNLALAQSDAYVRAANARIGRIEIIDDRTTAEPAAAPINQLPTRPQSTTQGEALLFSEETDNLISIFDADTDDDLQLVLSVDGGSLSLASTAGLTFTTGDGQDDAELNLTGTQAAINQALNGLRFQPDAEFTGQAQLSILSNDQDRLTPQQDQDNLRFVVFPEPGTETPLVDVYEGNWFGTNSPGGQTFQLTLESQNTGGLYEVGLFRVDDANGRIDGITPGESGYTAAALGRSRVVMSALSNFSDNLFPGLETSRQLTMDGNAFWGFYLVTNSTTDTIKGMIAEGQTPGNLSFGFAETGSLRVDALDDGRFTLNFKDGSGRIDFDALKVTLTPTFELPTPIGTNLQDQNEGELIDLRDYEGFKAASFGNFSEAAYSNELGFYTIDDEQGAIDALMPGDTGYAAAALARRVDFAIGFEGGQLFAPFMVANGTVSGFLAQNPTNQFNADVHTYFAFSSANPDTIDHVRLLGDNTFAFEDLLGGGDLDYNDAMIQIDFV
ncbi:MAG: DUF4347 domain-containing protein [Cyanobacteria bacterium P01_G01_bin.54]